MELLFTDDFRLPNKFAGFVIKDTDSVDIIKSPESVFSRFLSRSLLPGFLGFLQFCQLFSMALRTAFLIRMVHERFSPSSGTCLQPLDALHLEAFQPWVTEMCVISVCTPTSLEVKPWDFNRRTRQRIRYAWLLSWRKPSSNCRLSDIN